MVNFLVSGQNGLALLVVARSMLGIRVLCILSPAKRTSIVRSRGAVNASKLALVVGEEHVLRGFGQPAVDEVAVRAVRRSACELERRRAGPAVGEDLAEVVADGEAQLRDALHSRRAAVRGLEAAAPVLRSRVCRVEAVLVDAVGEQQQRLEMGRAGRRGEGGHVLVAAGLAFAEPLHAGQAVDAVLGNGGDVAGDGLEVLRDGDLGVLNGDVVGAESAEGDNLGSSVISDVESWDP